MKKLLTYLFLLPLLATMAETVPVSLIRVGFFHFDGYHMIDDQQERSGYGYDYLQNLGLYTDFIYDYIGYDRDWQTMQKMLENGDIDILTSAQKTPERQEKFDFSTKPIGQSATIITVKAGNRKYLAGDYQNWQNARVGLLKNNTRNDSFAKFAAKEGFTYTPVYFDNTAQMLDALKKSDRIDMIVTSNLRKVKGEWILATFDISPFYIIIKKGNPALLKQINDAIDKLELNHPGLQSDLRNRYYSADSGSEIAFSPEERLFIQKSQRDGEVYQAIINPDRAPFSYIENDQIKGIIADITGEIIQRTGLKIEPVYVKDRIEYSRLASSGKIPIQLDAWNNFSNAEYHGYKLTAPYLTASISRLRLKGLHRKPKSIAMINGSDILHSVLPEYGENCRVAYYDTIDEAVEAVKNGREDMTFLYTRCAELVLHNDEKNLLTIDSVPGKITEYAIAVNSNQNALLRSIINKAALSLNESELKKTLMEHADYPDVPFSLLRFFHTNPFLAAGIPVAVLLLLTLTLSVVILARRKAYRTAGMIKKLPLRFFVIDKNEKILHYELGSQSDFIPSGRPLRTLSDFPDCQVVRLMRKMIPEVLATGQTLSVDFEFDNTKRTAQICKLDHDLFNVDAAIWISQDTEELQNAKAKAQNAAEQLLLTLKSIGDGVIVVDTEQKITLSNPIAATMIGLSEEEMLGKPINDVFKITSYLDDAPIISPVEKALASGEIVELANHTDLISHNGERYHIADSAAPIRNQQGTVVGAVLVFRDVTRDYEQRDRLKEQNMLWLAASEIADMTYFVFDPVKMCTTVPASEKYWPYRDGQPIPLTEWLAPENREEFLEEWQKLIAEKSDSFRCKFRAGLGDDKNRFFEIQAVRTRLAEGTTPEIIGSIHEITRQTLQEQERDDAQLMLHTILNNLQVGVVVKDARNHFRHILCNQYFLDKIDRTAEEIIGKNEYETQLVPENTQLYQEQDEQVMRSGKTLQTVEEAFLPKSGRIVFQKTKVPLKLLNGRELLIVSCSDITRQYNLLESERIVNKCLSEVVLESNLTEKINKIFETIANQLKCDRISIARFDGELHESKLRYEWVDDGIESLHTYDDGVVFEQILSPLKPHMEANELCVLSDVCNSPYAANFLPTQTRSLISAPIFSGGTLWGVINVSFIRRQRVFSEVDENLMRSAAHLIAIAEMQQRQIDQLATAHRERALILNNINIPICLHDHDGKILQVNTATCELTGKSEEELLHDPFREVFYLDMDTPENTPLRQVIATGKSATQEIQIAGRDYIIHADPILDADGKLLNIIKSAVDVTEIEKAKRQQEAAMKAAQAADAAKSYFLATMSHEIRTPLNAVIGFTELLQLGDITQEEEQQYLEAINLSSNALLTLINDVLDISKLEAGQVSIVPVKISFAPLLEEIKSIFLFKAKEKNLTLSIQNHQDIPPLYLDRTRMRQVLLNLVGNAIKFTPSGSVTITSRFVPGDDGKGVLTIDVADTGIGISEAYRSQVFQPFTQQDSVRGNRKYGGTGLGLTISKRLVENMGGDLSLESSEGHGSVFTVTLPAVRYGAIDEDLSEEAAEESDETNDSCASAKILLVDDVQQNLEVLSAMLRKQGFSSKMADSGKRALEKLNKENFDMVMTDLWMPDMNGAELAAIIRERMKKGIQLVAVTADVEAAGNFDMRNFDAVLLKPVTGEKLSKLFNSLQNNPQGK